MEKLLESKLPEDLTKFFSFKKNIRAKSPEWHYQLYKLIESNLKSKISINEDKNYSHSTNTTLYLSSKADIIDLPELPNEIGEKKIIEKVGGEVFTIHLFLSDVGHYAEYFFNKKKLVEDNIEIDYLGDESELPEELINLVSLIKQTILKQGISIFSANELSEEKLWKIDGISFNNKYTPTIEEWLFGSFEFYRQTNL